MGMSDSIILKNKIMTNVEKNMMNLFFNQTG